MRIVMTSCLALVIGSAAFAADEQGEGPFVGGVFERPVGQPYLPPEPAKLEFAPLQFDDQGKTNELIVVFGVGIASAIPKLSGLLDDNALEQGVVTSINAGDRLISEVLGQPVQARFLIEEGRLPAEERRKLAASDPYERLHQYIVLSYASVAEARAAQLMLLPQILSVTYAALDQRVESSAWTPNDPLYKVTSTGGLPSFQWGMRAMNFPDAWGKALGYGYVAAVDSGVRDKFEDQIAPVDLSGSGSTLGNYRRQFSFKMPTAVEARNIHGTHVMGIIGAVGNNNTGVVGACPSCSVSMIHTGSTAARTTAAFNAALDRGAQVINYSGGLPYYDSNPAKPVSTCAANPELEYWCTILELASTRDTLLVASAGNTFDSPTDFPANDSRVLSVAGAEWGSNWSASAPANWKIWRYFDPSTQPPTPTKNGSSRAGLAGVVGPAKAIVSTMPVGDGYPMKAWVMCGDNQESDESGPENNGYGSCTGTSMAAPHVAGLAGILRSIQPRLTRTQIADIIRASGSRAAQGANTLEGWGLVNAQKAVDATISKAGVRLTPLFSMYSSARLDSFYTTAPQMAVVASLGTLRPVNTADISTRYSSAGGSAITGYSAFPGGYAGVTPRAAVWIFTTSENPKNAAVPLVPLYRMSWKCTDASPYPPEICVKNRNHTDTVMTADVAGVTALADLGYQLDGIEGYIYPKNVARPTGAVKLMRKYNRERDDHAIFPDSQLTTMARQGYSENTGSDWLGYVYPNSNGSVPTIQ